jgi:hypothetical protein
VAVALKVFSLRDVGKGTGEAAGNLATLHPGHAAADLGKGAAGAGKDVGVGAGKGAGKIGEGSAKGLGKLGGKIFHRGNKNKDKNEQKPTGKRRVGLYTLSADNFTARVHAITRLPCG